MKKCSKISFFAPPLVCSIRSICNIWLRLLHSFVDWYLIEFFQYVSVCTLGTKIELCVGERVACWCWSLSFFKCPFNGLGSSSLKKSFINIFSKAIYSGSVSVFELLYIFLKVLKFYRFSKMIRLRLSPSLVGLY